ncbi:MAG: hypothetical protein Q7U14_14015 [Lacisediminimonas sp.]|nr:hypothetical protein [Lacisediminimonas sp.]
MMAPPNNSNHDTALRHAPAETSHTTMAAATGIVMMLSPKKVMSCQAIMEEVKNRQMEGRRNTVDWAGVAAVQRLRSLQRISAGLPLRLCKPVRVTVAGRCEPVRFVSGIRAWVTFNPSPRRSDCHA